MKQQTVSLSAWLTLLALATIWGGSFLAFALILREVPVLTIVVHRVLWAALFLWGLVFFMGIARPNRQQWGTLLVMGFLNNVIPFSPDHLGADPNRKWPCLYPKWINRNFHVPFSGALLCRREVNKAKNTGRTGGIYRRMCDYRPRCVT